MPKWRLNQDGKAFDEFVLSGTKEGGDAIHIERMNRSAWFVDVCGIVVWVVEKDGRLEISDIEVRDTALADRVQRAVDLARAYGGTR